MWENPVHIGNWNYKPRSCWIEHCHQSCSEELKPTNSGPFGFWLRFDSVTGFSNLLLHRRLAKTQKSPLLIATSFLSML